MKNLSIVVSGSFRKHLLGIQEKIKEFQDIGIEVLSPSLSKPVDLKVDFIILESDVSTDPKVLELNHLIAISKADGLYIHNVDGYIGSSATLEFGYALALKKPVFVKEIPIDVTLKLFCKVTTVKEIKTELERLA